MESEFRNVCDDRARAEAYSTLDFPGTYYLAYRDLPEVISAHVRGRRAVDFGCGTGRSTRFLRGLGFDVVGVDVSPPMLALARERDPVGDYRLVQDGDLGGLEPAAHDLVLSAFTFDNVATLERKVLLLARLKGLLNARGRLVNLVSSPEIYLREWASFSTRDFPENLHARCGDEVRIVMLDVADRRPVVDVVWTDEGYREAYRRAGLNLVKTYRPLGKASDPCGWVNEDRVAPWVIYVLD